MARTRSTKTAATGVATTASSYTLPSKAGPPPRLLVLPKLATSEARIVTLPHPRHGRPARYFACPETGIYEFTRIAAPKSAPRSWLIEEEEVRDGTTERKAQTVMDADLFVATAIDPLFLALPALADRRGPEEKKRLFLSSDDHLDKLPGESSHLSELLRWDNTRALMERRMAAVCDTVEGGDETMFRLSEDKLLAAILDKARRMSTGGLPSSMEDKFVKRVLDAPVLLQKRAGGVGESQESSGSGSESQSSGSGVKAQQPTPRTESATSVSQPSTAVTSSLEEGLAADSVVSTIEASPDVVQLQRLRVAFDFICSSYVPPVLADRLQLSLKDAGAVDFSPLDAYLVQVAGLRAEAMASGPLPDFSQKRQRDEEDGDARAEKKRKLEEEKKRKASESRGVRELRKVNTSGMKKLSEFFKAK